MRKFRKIAVKCMSIIGALSIGAGVVGQSFIPNGEEGFSASAQSNLVKTDALIDTNIEQYFDPNVVQKLPDTVADNQEISVIVQLHEDSLMDAFNAQSSVETVSDYVTTRGAKTLSSKIERKQNAWISRLNKSGIDYKLGERYDTLLNGFEISIKAKDFEKANEFFANDATLIVGDVYETAQAEPVHNYVDVYESGIFDSSKSEYQGDGVVVAVLDTGLDYTHTAFSVDNFTTEIEAETLSTISAKVGGTEAAKFTPGLTGADVYMNAKVPYAYDYADKDPDVLPINSDHGTHVAGIIAGNDDEITGVAPNAQLAIMKVFSDAQQGAKDSWIIAALEDCVILGVDVINMSLGSGCGFTREVDKENKNIVYDKIREAGISLIAAAGNDYNATMGSTKNGNNGLTSNPDSGPVGAPSTYEASLAVASIDGVKTPYLRNDGELFYFKEATAADAKPRHFVDEILAPLGVDSYDFEYVTIPGIGRSSDYPEDKEFYKGKIVLVKRGQTTFEDKVRVATVEKGAAGIIIYNNVSGDISMSIGESKGAVCSIAQDVGEKLAAKGTGIIKVSKNQVAGPFMSDFSSWGPTSDLKIKPEITAHGGEIYSAVPGQAYDRLSGTSMAAPNQAGAAALIRQFVKDAKDGLGQTDPVRVTSLVNQLMMSTSDIVLNKNGLPYSVRKQGSGLINIKNSYETAAYVSTFEEVTNKETGEVTLQEMDKTKLELGDDKNRTGVYEMTFAINNISANSVTYELGSIIQTEGVSEIYTSHGDTTVTQQGYLLDGTQMNILSVVGGTTNGMNITVPAKNGNSYGTATVTVQLVLSADDKAYLEESFQYGMYVEGYITMRAVSGTSVDMSVPVLAFYGDWTEAPIFDEEYYDTHKDEMNAGLDDEDKLMPDAYATRVIGGLYSDYISTLGTYYFAQDPSATPITADKDKIALSNQEMGQASSLNSIYSIWAGLLRNVKKWDLTIVEDSTGEVIFTQTGSNQRKSYSSGGSIYYSNMDVDFKVLEHNLKNNTKYTVTVEAYIDYGTKAEQNNVRNVFEFPLYIDFEAPVVTDVQYRTEYDKTTKKTSLFADISVYDNHYAMGMMLGQITPAEPNEEGYIFSMESFGKYMTPVYSSFNSTSVVTVELTDYIQKIKNSCGIENSKPNDGNTVVYNNNSFIINCYDYAMNAATYEVRLPDEILSMYFDVEDEILRLSPNETKDLTSVLKVFPEESWLQTLDFETSDNTIVDIVNQTLIAKKSGEATITAVGYDRSGNKKTATLTVKVLAEGEEGYNGSYSIPEINKFALTGYTTNKAFYAINSDERDIGTTGATMSFGKEVSLSMFPSESVTLLYDLDSYFPDKTGVTYSVGNSRIATVSEDGTIVAQSKGTTIVSVDVTFDGNRTFYSGRVTITVKDPYTANSIYLMSYKGLGGEVIIPEDRGFTTIYAYAFSNYEYVEKDLTAGDVIDEEDPYHIKQQYLGEDTITKVVIPEGVTHINEYAFAGLTALEEVVLPKSLINIGVGAFYNCTKLKKINLQNVKFINASAFENTALEEVEFELINAIGNYAFRGCKLNYVVLPKSSQSLGIGTFANNTTLMSVNFKADKIKLGSMAFVGCTNLMDIKINAAVISAGAFDGCTNLKTVELGKDVSVISEFAFAGTAVEKFTLNKNNVNFELKEEGALVYKKGGSELVLAAPMYKGKNVNGKLNVVQLPDSTTAIAAGAFSGNTYIMHVIGNNVTHVGTYAFARCTNLETITMDSLTEINDYAFAETALIATPNLEGVEKIGNYAFAFTKIKNVVIDSGVTVGAYAFAYNTAVESLKIGDNVTIGEAAFYCPVNEYTYDNTGSLQGYTPYYYDVLDEEGNVVETYEYYRYDYSIGAFSSLTSLKIGANVEIGALAFYGNVSLKEFELGDNAIINDYAFYNVSSLEEVDLSKAQKIGAFAFSGAALQDYWLYDDTWMYAYDMRVVNGEFVALDFMYSSFAPKLEKVDLSSVTFVDDCAFSNNRNLKEVTIGENISARGMVDGKEEIIPGKLAYAIFAECESIENVVLPATVTEIGDYAFYRTGLQSINLENVDSIGISAFVSTSLTEVSLKKDVKIGSAAFAYCYDLAKVKGIEGATVIGDMTFLSTAITEATLTNATEIGSLAFGATPMTKVELGDKLTKLGENPFYATQIATYGKQKDVVFNGQVVGTELNENYEVGENNSVKIIDGVLYQVLPNGKLELVSYPTARESTTYTVVEGTARIADRAFAESALRSVTLASTLVALGDKAFFGCKDLTTVIFLSYKAPILEEEYDTTYLTYENLPQTGYLGEYKGLGIAPYYMWNVTSNFTSFYYGANFVNHIGHIENKLVMVRPANGQQYDTFIMEQYFGTMIEGNHAATEATLKVIAMIAALPDAITVTIADKEVIEAARAAYNNLPNEAQKSLVDTTRLDDAETILNSYVVDPPAVDTPVDETEKAKTPVWAIVLIIVEGVLLLACIALIDWGKFMTKVLKSKAAENEETEGVAETEVVENAESSENSEE